MSEEKNMYDPNTQIVNQPGYAPESFQQPNQSGYTPESFQQPYQPSYAPESFQQPNQPSNALESSQQPKQPGEWVPQQNFVIPAEAPPSYLVAVNIVPAEPLVLPPDYFDFSQIPDGNVL